MFYLRLVRELLRVVLLCVVIGALLVLLSKPIEISLSWGIQP